MYLITTFVAFLYLNVPFNTAQFPIHRSSLQNFQDFRPVGRSSSFLEFLMNPTSIISNDHIVDNFVDLDLKANDMNYYLYTKDNIEEAISLQTGDTIQLKNSSFNPAWPTKIVIHGWMDSGDTYWLHDIRRNYLSVGDYNVICINWFTGSSKEYFTSVKLVRQVGEYIAEFLEFLVSEAQLSLEDVHIVGHSLGAHVAGHAGNYVSSKLGRITGLDPASPTYEMPYLKNTEERLDLTDADFVDVIHTCAGNLGFVHPIGHADFYPNGGIARQPGCPVFSSQYCSHQRAHQYFAESIVRPDGFIAAQCATWIDFLLSKCGDNSTNIVMGEFVSSDTRGIYFLETNAQPPFGKGKI